ncbi:MAG: DNA-binding protein, partial [Burkholderia sp.]|nr:DNA-binding protein [Burkholderia sp.]
GPEGAFQALAPDAACTSSLDDVIRFVDDAFAVAHAQGAR